VLTTQPRCSVIINVGTGENINAKIIVSENMKGRIKDRWEDRIRIDMKETGREYVE
jgi:hypothetical protein